MHTYMRIYIHTNYCIGYIYYYGVKKNIVLYN